MDKIVTPDGRQALPPGMSHENKPERVVEKVTRVADAPDEYIRSLAHLWHNKYRVEVHMLWAQGHYGTPENAIRALISRQGLRSEWVDQRLGRAILDEFTNALRDPKALL